MPDHIRLEGLLVTSDKQVLSVMNRVLENFAIRAEVCTESESVLDTVTRRRLDAVIVDWNGASTPIRVVSAARKSAPNNHATIVAMVSEDSEMQAAILAGANFIIHKPANLEHATQCMRMAYSTMLQQRRRSARCPVQIPVVVTVAELGRLEAKIVDISIGGLALQTNPPLRLNWTISAKFALPDTNDLIHLKGKVVNTDGVNRAGVCFSVLPERESDLLVNWLATALAKLHQSEIPIGDVVQA
jgi:CheY-like chemotaxis protein